VVARAAQVEPVEPVDSPVLEEGAVAIATPLHKEILGLLAVLEPTARMVT